MNDAPASPDHDRIGAYQVRASLGRGGMGEVYLAWDERLERHVALKRLHGDVGDAERARLQREARAVARLRHPAIVQIYDLLDAPEGQYLVMEYVEGSTLSELVSRRQIDLRRAVDLVREIAEGLSEAHTKGLVHRDLKSDNVIVTAAGHARILDFGLARALWHPGMSAQGGESGAPPSGAPPSGAPPSGAESPGVDWARQETLTAAGTLVGTAHAMSPEQASGRPVDHRSDLFSLGGLVYEMLTGRAPFRGANLLDTLRRVTSEEPVALAGLRPEAPAELVDLVERLLAKDPAGRPRNARLVAAELEKVSVLLSGPASPAPVAADPPTETLRDPGEVGDLPTATGVRLPPGASREPSSVIRVLVFTDLVDSTRLVELLGDARAFEVLTHHDRAARDILARFAGHEIDKSDGFFLLFERPADAVGYALAYHQALARLSRELEVELEARVGIHLGEVFLHHNAPADVARGAKSLEVEGLAKPTAGRVMSLSGGKQTLLTRGVFDLARRAAVGGELADPELRWLAHGTYVFQGVDEPLEVFEVGVEGFAPLAEPADSEKAKRTVAIGEEITLGWRPAAGQAIPRRRHWQLAERLGEGGFGEVWLAAHKSGEKRVFKFCFEAERLGALKREVTLFRLLRDALGQRDDIARILDWNFEVAPYFLESEHTAGGDLAQWAEEQGGLAAVPLPVRLELVAEVAEALHAAHSVGVLHKDVKPENILITGDREGRPRARLTDFGLGLLTQRERLVSRGITALGFSATKPSEEHSSGGTWQYMAPELTEGKPATIQADIYSLGVVLYQIVACDFRRSLAPGWRRHVDDELLTEDIAALVDGSPDRRPASALEVAERLRHLDERRERRRAERRAEREAARAARRRRLVTAVAVLSTLVLGIVSVLAITASRARDEAELRRQQSAKLIDFMLTDLRPKIEDKTGSLAILDDVGEEAMDYFAAIPPEDFTPSELLSHPQALRQIGSVRLQRGDVQGGTEAFQKSLTLADNLARRDPDNSEWQLSLAASHYYVGYFFLRTKALDDALVHFQAYRDVAERWVALAPDDETWQLELAYAHSNIASVLITTSDPDGALRHLETSAGLMESLVARQPESSKFLITLSTVYSKIGTVLEAQLKLEDSLRSHQQVLDIRRTLVDLEPDNYNFLERLAEAHYHIANLLRKLGKTRLALEQYRADLELAERLANQDPENDDWRHKLSVSHSGVGTAYRALGKLASAENSFRNQLDTVEKLNLREPDHPEWRIDLALSHTSLASVLLLQGSQNAARRHVEEALAILGPMAEERTEDGKVHRFLSTSLWLLGRLETAQGKHQQARKSWEKAAAAVAPFVEGSHDPRLLVPWTQALLSLGRIDQARTVAEELLTFGYREAVFVDLCRHHGLLPQSISTNTP